MDVSTRKATGASPRARLLVATILLGFASAATTAAEPTITTVAGGCIGIDCSGDHATDISLGWPMGVAADPWGNFYIAVQFDGVYRVDAGGRISRFAGNSSSNYNGDGIPATEAGLDAAAVAVDAAGNVYVADKSNARVRMIARDGIIRTVAGNGTAGFGGDGGLAVNAALDKPDGVAVDARGNLYVLDRGNHRVRKVSNGIITTIAGNGNPGFTGDHGPARTARLNDPQGIAADPFGNVYIADTGNDRIRKVSLDGSIRTIAGGGPFLVDPVATSMSLPQPNGVAVDPTGSVLFSTPATVHRIEPDGTRSTVAGQFDGIRGTFSPMGPGIDEDYGDGGPAVGAQLGNVESIAFDRSGNLLVADQGFGRIRKVTPIPWKPAIHGLDAFSAAHRIPLAGWFRDIKIADMNGDGRADVVLTTRLGRFDHNPATDLRVHILLQRADGTLDAARTLQYGLQPITEQGHDGGKLAIADFNRDGVLDAAVSRTGGVDIVLGSRAGNFTIRSYHSMTLPASMFDIVATDFDRDGHTDIIGYSIRFSGQLTYIHGSGTASGSASFNESIPDNIGSMQVGDIDGDGNGDLVYSYTDSDGNSGIAVRAHNGRGSFSSPTRFPLSRVRQPHALAIGDIDGDGRKDLLFDHPADDQQPNLTRLGVMLQAPAGGLHLQEPIPAYLDSSSVAIGDVDRDGRADLVTFRPGGSVSLLRGIGHAAFDTEIKRFFPDMPHEEHPVMALGDINQDGLPDVLVSVQGIGLDILYGTSRPARRRSGNTPLARPDRSPAPAPTSADAVRRAMPSVHAAASRNVPPPVRTARSGNGGWPLALKSKLGTIALHWTSWRLRLYRDGPRSLFRRSTPAGVRSSPAARLEQTDRSAPVPAALPPHTSRPTAEPAKTIACISSAHVPPHPPRSAPPATFFCDSTEHHRRLRMGYRQARPD